MIEIKNFTATDLEFKELARIDNLVNHDSIANAEEDKHDWLLRDKSIIRNRLLLYKDNILIGVMYYSQGRDQNNKTAFFTLNLDPKHNNLGYRKLLYDKMISEISYFNCNKVLTSIYEHPNYDELKKILDSENFKLVQKNREYSCNIAKVDTKKYQGLINNLELEGVEFLDSKYEMLHMPNHYEKLEKLQWEIAQDFPIPKGISHTRTPFERWKLLYEDFCENFYGVHIVATYQNQYIGTTDISNFPKSEPKKGWTEGLGVKKEFRRRGIATALKIKAIESLRKKGISEIRTDNEQNNPMYKINVALGFEPVPFSLDYMKTM